jgi:prepilin-type processing-associated H-X9-DG protein
VPPTTSSDGGGPRANEPFLPPGAAVAAQWASTEANLDYAPGIARLIGKHSGGFSAVYGDGHAKWIKAGSTTPNMWTIQAD